MPKQLRPIGTVSGASVLVKCDKNGVQEVPIAPSTNRNCPRVFPCTYKFPLEEVPIK